MRKYCTFLAFVMLAVSAVQAGDWPQWRGPYFNGSTDEKNLPSDWSQTEGIAWSVDLPGSSAATPIIWADRVFLAGVDSIEIGDTICDPEHPDPLPRIAIDPPTIRVHFSANTSPFAGREGRFVTSRQIRERLDREVLGNVSIRVEDTGKLDTFTVAARGELQLAILVETMRREGYEFAVSRPEIILREIEGRRCEPAEQVAIDAPENAAGCVMEKLVARKGRMISMEQKGGRVRFEYTVPSRGLFGYRNEFLSDTRGEGRLYRTVVGYEPYTGEIEGRNVGGIVATKHGRSTPRRTPRAA